eukprot:scaffold200_cov173-Amphora_coffeaeformis.AAC.13
MEIDPPQEIASHHPPERQPEVDAEYRFDKWVDYLPHNIKDDSKDLVKRVSLDVTESHLTEDSSNPMETEDWPDSASLEDYAMVPNVLLVENDPVLQHELLLTDPSVVADTSNVLNNAPDFFESLQEVLEDRRRVLMASMEASQRTRRCLEPHIKQRASLACVLSDIEGSSKTLREHVLHDPNNSNPTSTASSPIHPIVEGHDLEEDEEMLASAALDDLVDDEEPPPAPVL